MYLCDFKILHRWAINEIMNKDENDSDSQSENEDMTPYKPDYYDILRLDPISVEDLYDYNGGKLLARMPPNRPLLKEETISFLKEFIEEFNVNT